MTEVNKQQIRERLGNLDQIRDLLFGQKIEDYDRQFQEYKNRIDKLESDLQQFHSETNNRFTLLQNSLSTEIRSGFDSLEQKIRFLNLTAKEKNSKLKQEIDDLELKTRQNLDYSYKYLTSKTNKLSEEIDRVKAELSESITFFKQQTMSQIDKDFLDLKDSKISRIDLAEVLFELCLKLRGNESFSRIKEAEEEYKFSKLSAENYNGDRLAKDNEDLQTA